jgi:hypothetical protein
MQSETPRAAHQIGHHNRSREHGDVLAVVTEGWRLALARTILLLPGAKNAGNVQTSGCLRLSWAALVASAHSHLAYCYRRCARSNILSKLPREAPPAHQNLFNCRRQPHPSPHCFVHRTTEWYRHMPTSDPVICRSIAYLSQGEKLNKNKKQLIRHYQDNFIKTGEFSLSQDQMLKCAGSEWEFDRILLYLFEEMKNTAQIPARLEHIAAEKESLDAANWKGSLAPLHYAVRSVAKAISKNKAPKVYCSSEHLEVVREVRDRLDTPWAHLARFLKQEYRGKRIYENCDYILANSQGT